MNKYERPGDVAHTSSMKGFKVKWVRVEGRDRVRAEVGFRDALAFNNRNIT